MKHVTATLLVYATLMGVAHANDVTLESAIDDVRINCQGISDELSDLKTMAGINTAVTGVGTGLGIGATIAGFKKQKIDATLNMGEDAKMAQLQKVTRQDVEDQDEDVLDAFDEQFYKLMEQQRREESKKLGNIRTGLLAANTATNIAGTVISATNRVDDTLNGAIAGCVASVERLYPIMMQAKIDGNDTWNVFIAQNIIDECGEYKYAKLKNINTTATGATISSASGAATGLVGTITSALANSKSVRDNGGNKEKNLNTASNVLSITSTVASGTATIFNASQISAIKKVADIATQCEEALQ